MPETIPIFPLHLVLFPGVRVPLRIFEPRYLDMVSRCLSNGTGFGVCLIKTGRETGEAAKPAGVGTYARIIDWQRNPDGLLGITIQGQRRFRLLATTVQPDNLIQGDVDWLDDAGPVAVPEAFRTLQALLAQHLGQHGEATDGEEFKDAVRLSYRLAALLPASQSQQQQLLELTDPLARLEKLKKLLNT